MDIQWRHDVDNVLEAAKAQRRPVLLDFSAAPMCSGCARLEAEVWPDERVVQLVGENFLPARLHVRDDADAFKRYRERYGSLWTPTILLLDPDGKERHRIEGFLPADDFLAQLTLGLGHLAFQTERWSDAERWFKQVVEQFPQSEAAAEALYWAGVSRYKGNNDKNALAETAKAFEQSYRESSWAKKASVWRK